MLTDLRGHYCVGLGMLGFGTWGVIGQYSESGSVVIGGAILIAAAIIANSISSSRETSKDAKSD
jgi:hypothetical protein